MSITTPTVVTGQNLYDFVTTTLLGFSIDQTYFLTLLNVSRGIRENTRNWKYLQTIDKSQSVATSDTYLTAKTLPADFVRLTKEGTIKVFDGVNKYTIYTEVPMDQQIEYKDATGKFYIDYFNMQYFLCGKPDQAYTIWMPYQADPGDITLGSSWLKFPPRFAWMLAYDVAAMYRLGADYDDINARMGDQNAVMAQSIFRAMEKWDNELALSAVTQMDYPPLENSNSFVPGHINPNL